MSYEATEHGNKRQRTGSAKADEQTDTAPSSSQQSFQAEPLAIIAGAGSEDDQQEHVDAVEPQATTETIRLGVMAMSQRRKVLLQKVNAVHCWLLQKPSLKSHTCFNAHLNRQIMVWCCN
eukprot:356114-Chlamydomonas_euryale.AAC.9